MRRIDRASLGVVSFATLLGLGIRLGVVTQSRFPLNDGGLFYAMITDLMAKRLSLPVFTTYNHVAIPYAYPPLTFYVYALLSLATRISVLDLMHYLPALISCASIPAFYGLAEDVLESKTRSALATVTFALLPRSFEWLIMGGGVTRSFGLLFALLALRQAYRLFSPHAGRGIAPLALFSSLVVYSHPEAATHTAIGAVVFYLLRDRSRAGLLRGLAVAMCVAAATAPWWGTVLARNGLDPFLAAAAAAREDSYNVLVGLLALFRFQFADEPFLSIFSVLSLVGIAFLLARRQLVLPLWLLAMHTLEPRGGPPFMMMPIALAAGVALHDVVLPSLQPRQARDPESSDARPQIHEGTLDQLLRGGAVRLLIGFIIVYGIAAAYATGWTIVQQFTLSSGDLQAITWVRDNTPPESRFALVTQGLPLRDATAEWFPALSARKSVATVFGFEWILQPNFASRIAEYRSLQACAPGGAECLKSWAMDYRQPVDYIYVTSPAGTPPGLVAALGNTADFETAYSNASVTIFRRLK